LSKKISKIKISEAKSFFSHSNLSQKESNFLMEFCSSANEEKLFHQYIEMSKNPQDEDELEAKRDAKLFLNLVKALGNISEEVLLISIGCAVHPKNPLPKEQQLPNYIRNISKTMRTKVILIDPLLAERSAVLHHFPDMKKVEDCPKDAYRYASENGLYNNLTVEAFPCCLPWENNAIPLFYSFFQKVIENILSRNGKVFIANHTQMYTLEDIKDIGIVYNNIKKMHPKSESLQLYTSGAGSNGRVRYYLDKLYDQEAAMPTKEELSGRHAPLSQDHLSKAFFSCSSIADLAFVPAFGGSRILENQAADPDQQMSSKRKNVK
jgi:hypothetical protein